MKTKPMMFYRGAKAAWQYVQDHDVAPRDEAHGTMFYPLPLELRLEDASGDNGCCCPYCSPVWNKARSHGPVWDTLAVGADRLGQPLAWLVHHPKVNGRRKLKQRVAS